MVTIVRPLIEADSHAFGDAVLADAATHVVSADVDAEAVRAGAVATIEHELDVEPIPAGNCKRVKRCTRL